MAMQYPIVRNGSYLMNECVMGSLPEAAAESSAELSSSNEHSH